MSPQHQAVWSASHRTSTRRTGSLVRLVPASGASAKGRPSCSFNVAFVAGKMGREPEQREELREGEPGDLRNTPPADRKEGEGDRFVHCVPGRRASVAGDGCATSYSSCTV